MSSTYRRGRSSAQHRTAPPARPPAWIDLPDDEEKPHDERRDDERPRINEVAVRHMRAKARAREEARVDYDAPCEDLQGPPPTSEKRTTNGPENRQVPTFAPSDDASDERPTPPPARPREGLDEDSAETNPTPQRHPPKLPPPEDRPVKRRPSPPPSDGSGTTNGSDEAVRRSASRPRSGARNENDAKRENALTSPLPRPAPRAPDRDGEGDGPAEDPGSGRDAAGSGRVTAAGAPRKVYTSRVERDDQKPPARAENLDSEAVSGGSESVHEREIPVHERERAVQKRETTPAQTPERRVWTEEELLEFVKGRAPKVPYIQVPEELRELLVEWRPILGEVKGFMALAQLILFSRNRDEHGVVCDYKTVFRSFGMSEAYAYDRDINSKMLLELYRAKVDPQMHYKKPSERDGLARKVDETGFPEEIIETVRRLKLCPAEFDGSSWVYLIDGKSANRRNYQSTVHKERMNIADSCKPTIDAPESARIIQHYLNHVLAQNRFAHGGYGIVASKVDDAIAYVQELKGKPPFDSEDKIDTALRTLYWMKHYPMPLYKPSDGSPRLKADHYNQLMNLASEVRPAFYTKRDYELDGAKMHMASFPVIARREGLSAPTVEKYLRASLDGEDLWTELADGFDAKMLPDAKARRKAAKISYCAVYGAAEGEMFYNIKAEYANRTGAPMATDDAVEGILEHPMIKEIFEVREKLFEIIDERGYLEDAYGRKIYLQDFPHKKPEARPRSVLAYVAASYEQRLIAELFQEATKEAEWAAAKKSRNPRFQIWLYQADGITLRIGRKQNHDTIIERLKERFDRKAKELGLITRLEVAWRHDDA